jgi:hypothetical protein
LLIHALGLLCVLSAAVFAAGATRRWYDIVAMPVGFAVAALWLPPDPALAGGLVALVSLSQLLRPGWRTASVVGAGVLAGLWAAWLRGLGWPTFPAVVVSAAVPGVSAWLSLRRPSFAPAQIREEALCAMGALGLVVAVGPIVTVGWSSAVALNLPSNDVSATGPAPWLLVVGASVALLGGMHSLWRRR